MEFSSFDSADHFRQHAFPAAETVARTWAGLQPLELGPDFRAIWRM